MSALSSIPMGLGHDICHIPRIYKILTSKRGPRFIKRVLTETERQTPRSRLLFQAAFARVGEKEQLESQYEESAISVAGRDPEFWKAAVYLAGRFAAKEAAIKAFPHHRLNFEDIQIVNRSSVLRVARSDAMEKLGTKTEAESELTQQQLSSGPPVAVIQIEGSSQTLDAALSISHDHEYASAVCMYFPGPTSFSRS